MIATLYEADGSSSTVEVAELPGAIVVRRGDRLDLYVNVRGAFTGDSSFQWTPALVVDGSAVAPPPPPP